MSQGKRFGLVVVSAALAALVVNVNSASAQRRGVTVISGGSSSSSSSGQSQSNGNSSDDDKDNKDKDKKNGNGQSGSSSSNSSGSNSSGSSSSSSGGNKNSGSGTGTSNKNGQQTIQQFQQTIQGGTSQGSQSRGSRGQVYQQGTVIQQGQSNSQQTQKFQPWQIWQGQNSNNNNNNNNNNNQKKNSSWVVQFGGGPQPFSVGWYDKHPQAWHWHNDHEVWQTASASSVIGWLGWGQPVYGNVVYQPVQTYIFDPNSSGPWMTLGVYSLLTGPSDSGTRILQLAVNQQGYIRGSYYDMITNETFNVRGRIDQQTQYIQWSIDTNSSLVFYTPLSQLTQSQGTVSVQLPGGTQQWQVVRMEYGN